MRELWEAYINAPLAANLLGLAGGFIIGWLCGLVVRIVRPRLKRWRTRRTMIPICGRYLTRFGDLYGIKRKFLEPDEKYRARIYEAITRLKYKGTECGEKPAWKE